MTTNSFVFKTAYRNALGQPDGCGPGRCRNCDTNLTSGTPADQYQRLKLIQNTVRVPASLYTMNVGALAAYQQAGAATHGVCWNQQSDRVVPSVGRATVPSGATTLAVSHKGGHYGYGGRNYSQTGSRPGAQTPGGVGCDIKHNCYMRRLNRLKAKAPLKQQGVPVNFGGELPFNPAFPIYGGKTMKTGIVAGCNCPGEGALALLYRGGEVDGTLYTNITYSVSVGQYVSAVAPGSFASCLSRALVLAVYNDGTALIEFDNGVQSTVPINELKIYTACSTVNGTGITDPGLLKIGFLNAVDNLFNLNCVYPNNPYVQSLFE